METIHPVIEPTADGSATLRHPILHESYHSLRGAIGESEHVYIGHGFRFVAETWEEAGHSGPIRLFEMGFGSGLNAWLTLLAAETFACPVEYRAVERYPIDPTVAARLGYTDDSRFMQLHNAPWGCCERITPYFSLEKLNGALESMEIRSVFDLVYYDAFAPDVQPELWSTSLFTKIGTMMRPGGVLVTYSAKGSVKQALREAGFDVHRLPGALGKHHMLRAIKQ